PHIRRVRSHVEGCESCRVRLRSISQEQPTPPTDDAPTERAEVGSAAWELVPQTRETLPAASAYPFLLPPVQPDEIVRLGPYRVLGLLGEGGMAYVFRAEDLALGRPVALKVMKPDLNDVAGWQRFLREARLLAANKHEHLVTLFQAGQEGNNIYFAM